MNYKFRQIAARPDRDGRCRVLLDVTWDGHRAKLPTGVSCLPAHFNAGLARPVATKDPASARLNALLAGVVNRVEKAALRAAAEERPLLPADLGAKKRTPAAAGPAPVALRTAQQFYAAWLADNPGQPYHSARRYRQVVAHLDAYRPDWPVSQLTRKELLDYLSHLSELALTDVTAEKHVRFFRECFRLAGQPVPKWLALRVRFGRSPALQAAEFAALMALQELPADLSDERDLFALQTLLLLRDSDLRQLRPHHVAPAMLPGCGLVPLLTFYQAKTGDEVRVPLSPAAAAIWARRCGPAGTPPPVPTQQERNRRLKQLAQAAQLDRPFVRVRYVQGTATEEVGPLYKVVSTHTARHTGADLLMLGSAGNHDLKEIALGHAGVYGHDSLERYGPALLAAWEKVLGATMEFAPSI